MSRGLYRQGELPVSLEESPEDGGSTPGMLPTYSRQFCSWMFTCRRGAGSSGQNMMLLRLGERQKENKLK